MVGGLQAPECSVLKFGRVCFFGLYFGRGFARVDGRILHYSTFCGFIQLTFPLQIYV